MKTRSSGSSGTVERIGNNTVFIGSTPRGIRREHFREMSDQLGFSSEIDMAEAVVKSTSIERRMMLKQFYVDRNSDLSGLSCFVAPDHETEVVSKRKKKDCNRVKRLQDKQLAVKCNDTVAKKKRKKHRTKVKFRKEVASCKGRDEKRGGRRAVVHIDQSGVKADQCDHYFESVRRLYAALLLFCLVASLFSRRLWKRGQGGNSGRKRQ